MQIDSISQYLAQVVHTNDTTSVSTKESRDETSASKVDGSSFDDYYNTYVSTNNGNTVSADDDRTPIQVAQDAYSEFLSWAANAVSGSSGTNENIINKSEDNDDSEIQLTNAINSYLSSAGVLKSTSNISLSSISSDENLTSI